MTFNHQKAITDYNYYMHLIRIGAYEERSSEHWATGTWPEDGIEESIFNLEELAAKENLEFCWDIGTKAWSLLPMSDETRAYMDTLKKWIHLFSQQVNAPDFMEDAQS